MLVRTIIVYAVLHSGITTKPECIFENSEFSDLWDYYQSAEQLQAAAQAHN